MNEKIKEALSTIKTIMYGYIPVRLEWNDEATEANPEDGFLLDMESVKEGDFSEWEFTFDPTVVVELETVVDTSNDNGFLEVRAQVYTDNDFNVYKIILIND